MQIQLNDWGVTVFDEGHLLCAGKKAPSSKIAYQRALSIKTAYRIMLTGTPYNNSEDEVRSLVSLMGHGYEPTITLDQMHLFTIRHRKTDINDVTHMPLLYLRGIILPYCFFTHLDVVVI
jgi:SNF2 family DNA or RNA helicase